MLHKGRPTMNFLGLQGLCPRSRRVCGITDCVDLDEEAILVAAQLFFVVKVRGPRHPAIVVESTAIPICGGGGGASSQAPAAPPPQISIAWEAGKPHGELQKCFIRFITSLLGLVYAQTNGTRDRDEEPGHGSREASCVADHSWIG